MKIKPLIINGLICTCNSCDRVITEDEDVFPAGYCFECYGDSLSNSLRYAKEFTPHKIGYYEELIQLHKQFINS